jgi:hypothetical protein
MHCDMVLLDEEVSNVFLALYLTMFPCSIVLFQYWQVAALFCSIVSTFFCCFSL